jgi:hypothetical protein
VLGLILTGVDRRGGEAKALLDSAEENIRVLIEEYLQIQQPPAAAGDAGSIRFVPVI